MKKYFLDLFEYNNWANDRIILKLQTIDQEFNFSEPVKIFGHIISSQDVWLERVKGKSSYNIDLWEDFSIQELEILSSNSSKEWKKYLTRYSEKKILEICVYKNSKREEKKHSYQDIFQHVLNHSSYHRGQINKIFSCNKIEPAQIEFIQYC
jgi:uncharacterized damage-inducible protein DinB